MQSQRYRLPFAHPELEVLCTIDTNSICFDCSNSLVSWASVNNAIFLCDHCADEHVSLGVSVSYVRSLFLDKWNSMQIQYLLQGGNKMLDELVDSFGMDKRLLDRNVFYTTKLLDYHRKFLKSQCENCEIPQWPKISEAFNPSGDDDIKENMTCQRQEAEESESHSHEGFMDQLKKAVAIAVEKVSDVGRRIKEGGEVVFEKGTELIISIRESELVKRMKESVDIGYNYAKENLFGCMYSCEKKIHERI